MLKLEQLGGLMGPSRMEEATGSQIVFLTIERAISSYERFL